MRAAHRQLVPAPVLSRLDACGITLVHITVPDVSYNTYPRRVNYQQTAPRFAMFASHAHPGAFKSIGAFDPQAQLFKTQQRVTYPFLGETDDEFFYNGVAPLTYRQDDFLAMLDLAATMTIAAGHDPNMVGVLFAYISQMERYRYPLNEVGHLTIPEYLSLITAKVSPEQVALARTKNVPLDLLLNPTLPVHLLLDLY